MNVCKCEPEERWQRATRLRRRFGHIVFLSACGLFLELVLIRWLDAQGRPLAYVKNLPLIGAFLGLGIGYATPFRRRPAVPYVSLLLATVLVCAVYLGSASARKSQTGPAGPGADSGTATAESPVHLAKFYALGGAGFPPTG